MLGQILGIAPSAVDSTLSFYDYSLLRNEYAQGRLLPQRLEAQIAYIPYLIASMFGKGGTAGRSLMDFVVFGDLKPRQRMSVNSMLASASVFGKKKPARQFTDEQVEKFNALEKKMIELGY